MKKLVLVLCLALALCLICGCGDNETKDPDANDAQPPVINTTPEPSHPGGNRDMSVFYKEPTHSSHYISIVINTLFANI